MAVGHDVGADPVGHAHLGGDGLADEGVPERGPIAGVAQVAVGSGHLDGNAADRGVRHPAGQGTRRARGTLGALAVAEAQLGLQGVRVERPGIQLVGALAAQQIVIALTAEEPVVIGRGADAGAAVSPQPVIAAQADQDIAACAAVQAVTPGAATQHVIARATIEHADKVVAAVVERRQVERNFSADAAVCELDRVVAQQARHPELFNQQVVAILPLRLEGALEQGVAGVQRIDRLVGHLQQVGVGRVLHQPDAVVLRTALDQQDVGGVVVRDVALALVAEVAVEVLGRCVDRIGRARVEHQHVDGGATVQRVAAVLAFQPVGVGAAPEGVVAATAQQLVFTAAAKQHIGPADQGGLGVLGVVGARQFLTVQVVVATVAEHQVGTQVAEQPVATGVAMQFVATQHDLGGQRAGRRIDRHVGVGVQVVDAIAAKQALPGLAVGRHARVAANAGVALASGVAEQIVVAGVAIEHVDAGAAMHHVGVGTATHDVVARVAPHLVACHAAVDVVGVCAAEQEVGVAAAEDEVDAGATLDAVAAVGGQPRQRQAVDRHRRDAWRCEATARQARCQQGGLGLVEADGALEVVGDAEIQDRGRHVLEAAPEDVVAGVAADGVVAGTADDDVVMAATGDVVVALIAIDGIVAGTA